ncbi:MAG: GumC family protein, partial [Cyanobium sp.]
MNGSHVDTYSSRPAEPTTASGEDQDIDLGKFIQAVSRRRRLAVAVLVTSLLAGSAITAWQRVFRPTYAGGFQLLVSDPINDEQRGSSLEDVALAGAGNMNTTTLVRVLGSPLLLKPVEEQLNLGVGSLSKVVSIAGGEDEDGVLAVNLQWPDPVQGEAILSKLTVAFLNYSLRQRQEKLTQGLSFLDQQAPELQQRVNRLQAELADFRRVNGFIEPAENAGYLIKERQQLSSRIATLQQEQARLVGRLASVRSGKLGTSLGMYRALSPETAADRSSSPSGDENQNIAAPQSAVSPDFLSKTPLESLYDVEQALIEAKANFTDDSPQVDELKAKRDRLKPLLQTRQQSELLADLEQNLTEQRLIQAQLSGFSKSFQGSPTLIKQYQEIQQQLDVALESLGSYIKARESFRLQVAQRTVPWSVLTPPGFSRQPVKPSLSRNLMLSLLLGVGGGVGAALLRDRLDPVFHDPAELREALPLPLLGVVPHLPDAKDLTVAKAVEVMDGGQRFETRESLRNLFANFRLLRADKTVRLV